MAEQRYQAVMSVMDCWFRRSLRATRVRSPLGMSAMNYLRQVRLRRAHQDLLAADPAVETVRFAAAHAARYGETPAAAIRRSERAIMNRRPALIPRTAR